MANETAMTDWNGRLIVEEVPPKQEMDEASRGVPGVTRPAVRQKAQSLIDTPGAHTRDAIWRGTFFFFVFSPSSTSLAAGDSKESWVHG
jgi:hypothetical protein